jgi:hypothetical protein
MVDGVWSLWNKERRIIPYRDVLIFLFVYISDLFFEN